MQVRMGLIVVSRQELRALGVQISDPKQPTNPYAGMMDGYGTEEELDPYEDEVRMSAWGTANLNTQSPQLLA